MNHTYAAELVRRLAPKLKDEFVVQPVVPLEIKLHLERLKLTELIRSTGEKKTRAAVDPRPEMQLVC
jgi:hypothetical protein